VPGCCTVAQNAVIAWSPLSSLALADGLGVGLGVGLSVELGVAPAPDVAAAAMPASLERKPTLSCDPWLTAFDHALHRPKAALRSTLADGLGDALVLGLTDALALGLALSLGDALSLADGLGDALEAAPNWWPCSRPVALACECAGGAAIT
jgi:hypothetical protein